MAVSRIGGVRIAGVASAVADTIKTPADDYSTFGEIEALKVAESTGVFKRHQAPPEMCSSDLCQAAAERLLSDAGWDKSTVDALIFVTQSPDYIMPATACALQDRLGLPKSCAAFDVSLGCSGYVYGLWLASSLISGGGLKRVLLLAGETTRMVSPEDRSVSLIFGDAGTATLLEKSDTPEVMTFVLGTDGKGEKNLIIPAGGCRKLRDATTSVRHEAENGNKRSEEDLFMNGPEIFAFTIAEVPKLVRSVIQESGETLDSIDAVVLHQANKFMLDYLVKRMKVPTEKVPMSLAEYGNTSSASIPLTMNHCLAERLRKEKMSLVLSGFGVGYSWGAVHCTVGNIVMPDVVIVDSASFTPPV